MADDLAMISRPFKDNEKDIKRLGQKSYMDLFTDELHKYEQKYTKLHLPFDRACARMDFSDKHADALREIDRVEGSVDENDSRARIDFGKLDSYADPNRFDKVNVTEDVVNRNVDGMIQPTKIGETEHYLCKHRKHRIAVFIPNDEIKRREATKAVPKTA